MDESLKQLVGIVVAVAVGVFLITYITTGGFNSKITGSIESEIDKIVYVTPDAVI